MAARSRTLVAAGLFAALLVSPPALQAPAAQVAAAPRVTAAAANARVIVKYRADSTLLRKQALSATAQRGAQAQALGQRIGVTLIAGAAVAERVHVVHASGLSSAQLAAQLAAQPDIEYAVPDERKHVVAAPNDPFYATRAYNNATTPTSGGPLVGQWYLKPPSASLVSAINAEQGWDVSTGSNTIVVAVLDTGLRFEHPDLQRMSAGGNVLDGYDFISADPGNVFDTSNDGNGRDADASDPGDSITAAQANDPNGPFYQCTQLDPSTGKYVAESSSWHGTQTLGLIGARTDNGVGIASVGRNVKVMPVRVLGRCGGYDSDIVAAMRWASGLSIDNDTPVNANPAKVINLSLGGSGTCSQLFADAVAEVNARGTVVVASAGNSAGRAVGSPANCPGVIAVAGLRHVGTKVGFSDLGSGIAISAPGGNCVNTGKSDPCLYPIATTSNAGASAPSSTSIYTDSFNYSVGTSFSAPLVAGAAALMLSIDPTLTPAQVLGKLQSSARAFPTSGGTAGSPVCAAPGNTDQLECYCTTSTCGAGMLDVRAALLAVGVQAKAALSTAAPVAGSPVTIDSASTVPSGQSIASYQWTIADPGTTGATIEGPSSGPSITVLPTAAGVFVAQLQTVDSNGMVSTTSLSVTVAAAPVVVSNSDDDDDHHGGGALDPGWLISLLVATAWLAAIERRAVRRRRDRLDR